MTGSNNLISECRRCGSCCKKGGPSFHQEDKNLIEKGAIALKYLYTIRQGELAYDNIKRCLVAAESDIIKTKEETRSRACVFFDETENSCRIYENRPIECRTLMCWDTRELEEMYSRNRLSRKKLISDIEGLWDLVEDHQTRCDYKIVKGFVDKLDKPNKKSAVDGLRYMINYDIQIRSLVIKKGAIDPEMVDFLLGLPLIETIKRFGLNVKKEGDKYHLEPSGFLKKKMNKIPPGPPLKKEGV